MKYNFGGMRNNKCMIKFFGGVGGEGKRWSDGEGVAVKESRSRVVGWGSLRDLTKNILKQGVGKGKSCS